jgi:hypothetical protein
MVAHADSRAAGPAAAAIADWLRSDAADTTTPAQIYNTDGERLPLRRNRPIVGAPSLACSTVWRWAADRWCEAQR